MSIKKEIDDFIKNCQSDIDNNIIKCDKALILLNEFLGKLNCSDLNHPTKTTEQKKITVASIAKQFPVVWAQKDLYNNVFPKFSKESYIEYISNLGNSYKNLPLPNYKPLFQLYDLPGFNKNWFQFCNNDFIEYVFNKQYNSKDYYNLSLLNFQKIIFHFPEIIDFIIQCYNNIIFENYDLCQEWCSANIIPRFKGGDKNCTSRFRPLMGLPLMCRFFDSILSQKFHDIVLKYNIIDTRVQKAILKDCSGIWENIFEVNMRLKKLMEEKLQQIFLFIDIKNAFGAVNYRTMLFILQKYNFAPELSNYFERYYKNVFGIYKTDPVKWKNGLFQGSALSNILFLIYIDFILKNIFQDLKGMKLISNDYDLQDNTFCFVDDTLFILPLSNMLDKQFNLIQKIFQFYGLSLNTNKSYFVIEDQSKEQLTINNNVFNKATKDFAYLGHSLFIFGSEVINNILEKTKISLMTIDSFNICNQVKAYIYYTNIFLRITRILEISFIISGKTPELNELFEEISYFIYRWNIKESDLYEKKHLDYILQKGSNKILKSNNLKKYHSLISNTGDITIDYKNIFGNDTPELNDMEHNLKTIKSNNYFPIEHFNQSSVSFYADNFVAWTD